MRLSWQDLGKPRADRADGKTVEISGFPLTPLPTGRADHFLMMAEPGCCQGCAPNNPLAVVEAQLANADLRHLFERVLSVEHVGRLKPAPEVYRHAAAELRLPVADVRLVAAHAWDVTGAIRAGAAAAFVARPGQVLDPTGETPDIVGRDLGEVVERIVALEG